ncbi:MAG: exodeoxyribonuclease III [Lysobacter sp.]|nr:MAG: exodeoxyribonuclease III [Lysobacter sp.]
MARLKLATFNINGIRARLGGLLEWLEREQPDIVCLQELKAPDESFPAADIESAGYGAIWQGQKSWNGVAILARGSQPRERLRGLPGDRDDVQSRYLEADVHGLVVGCLYLPNGNPWPGPKFDYKLAWFDRLIRHAQSLQKGGPAVLAGDFNVVPTDELDIYNAKSWRTDALLQPESRDAYRRLLAQGWTDSIRHLHGDARIYTFWDYFRKHWERDAGLRIDHLLLNPAITQTLKAANVDRWVRGRPGASDHAPTWIELEIGGDRSAVEKKNRVAARSEIDSERGPADRGVGRTVSVPKTAARKAVAKKRIAKKVAAQVAGRKPAAAKKTLQTAAKKSRHTPAD